MSMLNGLVNGIKGTPNMVKSNPVGAGLMTAVGYGIGRSGIDQKAFERAKQTRLAQGMINNYEQRQVQSRAQKLAAQEIVKRYDKPKKQANNNNGEKPKRRIKLL